MRANPILLISTPAVLVLAGTMISFANGVQSGTNGIPANAARTQPSCSGCHGGSFGNGPQVSLTATKHALQPNESISVSTTATGGVAGSTGGFVTEATGGTFQAAGNTRVMSNPASITHRNSSSRSWTYAYTAPGTSGLVELFSVAMTSNGSGRSGDKYSFAGYDPNDTSATPVRLFVLPQGVVNVGAGCPDGYGNQSVMGATGVPSVGNDNFALELHGTTPGTLGFAMTGFNPPGFTPMDLGALAGVTGCTGYVATPLANLSAFTSAGSAQRAEGSVSFPVPIPNSQALRGIVLDVQGAYIDPTAQIILRRSFPVSFANGLQVTIQ